MGAAEVAMGIGKWQWVITTGNENGQRDWGFQQQKRPCVCIGVMGKCREERGRVGAAEVATLAARLLSLDRPDWPELKAPSSSSPLSSHHSPYFLFFKIL